MLAWGSGGRKVVTEPIFPRLDWLAFVWAPVRGKVGSVPSLRSVFYCDLLTMAAAGWQRSMFCPALSNSGLGLDGPGGVDAFAGAEENGQED